jgi:hypothetical protein
MSEFIRRPSVLSDTQQEYLDFALQKAGRWGTSRYVVPSTEQVLEVHDRIARGNARITTTVTRDREPTFHYADRRRYFPYSQNGFFAVSGSGTFFSDTGEAKKFIGGHALRTNEGVHLWYPRLEMLSGTQPTDQELAQDIALMKEVGKDDRIIFRAFLPSHRGKTLNEIQRNQIGS